MSNWFVLYCKHRKDSEAESNLLNQQLEVYRPKLPIVKMGANIPGARASVESLFPRYLFIRFDPNHCRIDSIKYTRGVSGFVKFGDRLSTVAGSVIDAIREYEIEYSKNKLNSGYLKNGDPIQVNGGGFVHVNAIFEETCGDKRVAVLINIMGRATKVEVPMSFISKM